jgi:hypothetical protein
MQVLDFLVCFVILPINPGALHPSDVPSEMVLAFQS